MEAKRMEMALGFWLVIVVGLMMSSFFFFR